MVHDIFSGPSSLLLTTFRQEPSGPGTLPEPHLLLDSLFNTTSPRHSFGNFNAAASQYCMFFEGRNHVLLIFVNRYPAGYLAQYKNMCSQTEQNWVQWAWRTGFHVLSKLHQVALFIFSRDPITKLKEILCICILNARYVCVWNSVCYPFILMQHTDSQFLVPLIFSHAKLKNTKLQGSY